MHIAFDFATSALGLASYLGGWGTSPGLLASAATGVEGFAVANLSDRLLQRVFLDPSQTRKVAPLPGHMIPALIAAGVESCLYAGILHTASVATMIPRFVTALVLGVGAARSIRLPEIKTALCWAVAREIVVLGLPLPVSIPVLIAADSIVSGLNEVCPTKGIRPIPVNCAPWRYKMITNTAFRAIASIAALRGGIIAAVTQQALYNFSRSLMALRINPASVFPGSRV